MQLKIAEFSDIEATLKLHAKYQIDTIKEEDKKDGFVTTPFSKEELTQLIEQEQGLFIAKEGDEVLAYVMSASWEFWSKWVMFQYMIADLPSLEYKGEKLTTKNSYQYGPICIDKSVRGTSLLSDIFEFALHEMSKRYPILITFVNQINPRSFQAHHRKLRLDIIQEFEFNGNRYWELACLTHSVYRDKLRWVNNLNSIDWNELSSLYKIAPLGDKSPELLETVFGKSMFTYFVYDKKNLVGVGRALADGGDSAYLCDIAIHPDYQGRGLGKNITQKLLDDVNGYNKIILFASMGKSGFYEKLGFSKMTTAMAIFKNQDRVREMGFVE